jgi:polyphosphate kinase
MATIYLEKNKDGIALMKHCQTIIPCPTSLRKELDKMISREIKNAKAGVEACIILKMNSLSDEALINKLYEAAKAGVQIKLIIRGIFCMYSQNKKFIHPVKAISIVDEYLEHARVFIFHNGGDEKVFISSADWMVRNLDHRVEATCPIFDDNIKKVLRTILEIQLKDNVKARILDNELSNKYVTDNSLDKVRSQVEIYNYLYQKTLKKMEQPAPQPTENVGQVAPDAQPA